MAEPNEPSLRGRERRPRRTTPCGGSRSGSTGLGGGRAADRRGGGDGRCRGERASRRRPAGRRPRPATRSPPTEPRSARSSSCVEAAPVAARPDPAGAPAPARARRCANCCSRARPDRLVSGAHRAAPRGRRRGPGHPDPLTRGVLGCGARRGAPPTIDRWRSTGPTRIRASCTDDGPQAPEQATATAARPAARVGAGAGRLIRAWRVAAARAPPGRVRRDRAVPALFLPWYQADSSSSPAGTCRSQRSDSRPAGARSRSSRRRCCWSPSAVLTLLFQRAEGKAFHLPGGDGGVIMAAGLWTCVLIVWRIFDKQGASGHGQYATTSGSSGASSSRSRSRPCSPTPAPDPRAHRPEPPLPGESGDPEPAARQRARQRAAPPPARPQRTPAAGARPPTRLRRQPRRWPRPRRRAAPERRPHPAETPAAEQRPPAPQRWSGDSPPDWSGESPPEWRAGRRRPVRAPQRPSEDATLPVAPRSEDPTVPPDRAATEDRDREPGPCRDEDPTVRPDQRRGGADAPRPPRRRSADAAAGPTDD